MTYKRYWLAMLVFLGVAGLAGFFVAGGRSTARSAAAEPVASSMSITVDLSARELSVIENGQVTASYPVAIGKPSYPTPKGRF
ncbi:MAG TPA: L,D-transpeptidase, partial [Longimicrobiales bacterium]